MENDETYMKKALEEARRAYAEGEIPVGAVVVCGGRILARAHNLTETLTDVTAHAEMQAITAAANALGGKYLNECTLYVTVEPCVMCAGAIGWAQVKRLVYGAADEKPPDRSRGWGFGRRSRRVDESFFQGEEIRCGLPPVFMRYL